MSAPLTASTNLNAWSDLRRPPPAAPLPAVAGVEVLFEGIGPRLCALVRGSHSVVGAMAWFSDPALLSACAGCAGGVDIVVTNDRKNNRQGDRYRDLPARPPSARAVTRIGAGCGRFRAFMHHKFLVGLDPAGEPAWCATGSYNGTKHSRLSLENVLVARDPALARIYLGEFEALRRCSGDIPKPRPRRPRKRAARATPGGAPAARRKRGRAAGNTA